LRYSIIVGFVITLVNIGVMNIIAVLIPSMKTNIYAIALNAVFKSWKEGKTEILITAKNIIKTIYLRCALLARKFRIAITTEIKYKKSPESKERILKKNVLNEKALRENSFKKDS